MPTATQALALPLDDDVSSQPSPEHLIAVDTGTVHRDIQRRNGAWSRTTIVRETQTDDLHADVDKSFLLSKVRLTASVESGAIRVADLFCGCGAMSLGIAEACRALGLRFEPVLPCDINTAALGVYAANFGLESQPVRDLGELSSIIEGTMTPFEVTLSRSVTDVDLVVGGPPCQGHSNLNNHTRRNDPKNGLYFKVARFAKLFSPKHIIVENVPAVVRDHSAVVHRTTEALCALGYSVESGLVDMQRIGVAQTRKRHVLLASKVVRVPTIPEVMSRYRVPPRDVRWAIGDLFGHEVEGDLFRAPPNMTAVTKQRIDLLFEQGLHNLPDEHRPDCHRTKEHTYGAVYGRMHWDKPAPTITGGFVTMGQGRFVHPGRRSTLTPHEAARIQFIPDFFDFSSVTHRNRLTEIIGNAVPPKLSYVLALELLR